jgi:signal transduction histidine kinase
MTKTLRARGTIWHVAALGLALVVFALSQYVWLSRTLDRHHDPELQGTAERLAASLAGVALDAAPITAAVRASRVESSLTFVLVRNAAGDLIYGSPILLLTEPDIGRHETLIHAAAGARTAAEFFTVTLDQSGPVRFICVPIRPGISYVQVGSVLGDINAPLHAVALLSLTLIPIVVALTVFAGWLIAGHALAPMDRMHRALRSIQATDLAQRVPAEAQDQEVLALAAAINDLLDRLERAFRDLRDFSADVSHQLQTPLSIMQGTIDHARRAATHEETVARLDTIDQEIRALTALIADLQALSVAEALSSARPQAPVDWSAVCMDASEIIGALGEARGVTVSADIAPGVTVRGDAGRLHQIVLNLGENAVKYTEPTGRVALTLTSDNGLATLRVIDSGVGIPQSDLPRVFDRFYRGAVVGDTSRGTGLGLTIAKRLVEVHGGAIHAESQSGKGSKFVVTLPTVQRDLAGQARVRAQ